MQTRFQVEQPASSSLIFMPYIQHLITAMQNVFKPGAIAYKRLWFVFRIEVLVMWNVSMFAKYKFNSDVNTMIIVNMYTQMVVQLSWLGLYGHPTPKASWLLGSTP